jgi:hypothetical protein
MFNTPMNVGFFLIVVSYRQSQVQRSDVVESAAAP